jgi:leader peptidase (prepilin peptidase)/N-methyltransferase
MNTPLLIHPFAACLGFLLGLPTGSFLTTCVARFSYDDEFFDPRKGPRHQEHIHLSQLEDISFLPWPQRIPFFGYLIGMVQFCHFHLLVPPVRCEDCHHPLSLRDRLPVLAFLRLKGRCPSCAAPLPGENLWIEAVTPLFFALILAAHGPTLESLLYCLVAALSLVATVVDWNFQIIPDEVPTTGLGVGLGVGLAHTLFTLWQSGWSSQVLWDPWHLGWMVSGSLVGGLTLWVLQVVGSWLAGTTAMGGGDVKLAVALGLFVGPAGSAIGLFFAAFLGALSGLLVILTGGGKREGGFTKFAFGPYICLGILLVAFFGPELSIEFYSHFSMSFGGLIYWLFTGRQLPGG